MKNKFKEREKEKKEKKEEQEERKGKRKRTRNYQLTGFTEVKVKKAAKGGAPMSGIC